MPSVNTLSVAATAPRPQAAIAAMSEQQRAVTQQGTTPSGLYAIPAALYANANVEEVSTISRSNWVAHFSSILTNQIGSTGNALGKNNFRDTARDLSLGQSILQTRAPLLKTMLLASNPKYNFPQAIRYADQEYFRFRNRFARKLVQLRNSGAILDVDYLGNPVAPATWVQLALNALKIGRNPTFPFSLSTMGGGNYYIPPTPASLGVLPCSTPAVVTDTSYGVAIKVLIGHDGSRTALFGDYTFDLLTSSYVFSDYRDAAFFALENAIFAEIASVAEVRPTFDLQHWMNGKYSTITDGYTNQEVSSLLSPFFENWAQSGGLDYHANTKYDATNRFTWNYSGIADSAGIPLPGNWRGIYLFYFDTVRPHTNPWEMLGFTDMPAWWTARYGSAPYLRTNTLLWNDLEIGLIAGGPREGIDLRYARPGLANVIPVDLTGNLLDPVAAAIVPFAPTYQMANRPWNQGDFGPIETLWLDSPSYRFALAQISYLMKPGRFIEECWSGRANGTIDDQWLNLTTLDRPINADQLVHGEIKSDGTLAVVNGVQQWLVDYMVSSGLNSTSLGNDVRGLDVKLIHKMAGYVSSDLTAVTDNFGLIPAEDVAITLYDTPSAGTEVYSGVIVEWIGNGWRVIGYDARNSFFTIIPPDVNGPKGFISLATSPEPIINPWYPNTYYSSGMNISYKGSFYTAAKNHTSGRLFEESYWTPAPGLAAPLSPRVITYRNGLNKRIAVPYGTVFTTIQQVADFLLGWERNLVSRGWIFDEIDPASSTVRDWTASVTEFLNWTQIKWAPGNFIALSPGAEGLKFYAPVGTVLDVEDNTTGFFGLLDRGGSPISKSNVEVSRLDGLMTLRADNSNIFGARLRVGEIEHALIFNNTTIFGDIIFQPLFDLRQARIRLLGLRAGNWAGRLDAPGYIIEGGSMVSNYQQTTEDVRLMFDIELANRKDLRDYARHVVGFQSRSYLNNLLLEDTEQFEFYQGMIQQKGAASVFDALVRNTRVSQGSTIQFLEEWAILESLFGSPVEPRITLSLFQSDTHRDPQVIKITPITGAFDDWIVLSSSDARWLDPVTNPGSFFTSLPITAPIMTKDIGYVRLEDMTYTVFQNSDLNAIYTASTAAPLGSADVGLPAFLTGNTVWVYENSATTWDVLRVFEVSSTGAPNTISQIVTQKEDPTVSNMRLFFTNAHGLTQQDIGKQIVIDGVTSTVPDIQGIQTITNVDIGNNWLEVGVVGTVGNNFGTQPYLSPRIFRSMRYTNRNLFQVSTYPFAIGDLAYLDADPTYWSVQQFAGNGVWNTVRIQPARIDPSTIVETMIYNTGSKIVGTQMFLNEPLVDHIDIIDPIAGLLPGEAMDEIDFVLDVDPARYDQGFGGLSVDPWGAAQIGKVWWNTSTVRYLNPYTDAIGQSNARDLAELNYRATHWAQIAPNTSVDIYEWIASSVSPTDWVRLSATDTSGIYQGNVFNPTAPAFVQETTYNAAFGNVVTYYFWVSGRTAVPNVPTRKVSAATVATLLENPSAQDVPWFAPIANDTMIISGVGQLLNNTTSTLKVEISSEAPDEVHNQWFLLRDGDETSLPPSWLWDKLRDGLAQFDDRLNVTPYSSLHPIRQVGLNVGQNIFTVSNQDGSRGGILDARNSFVGIINNILYRSPILLTRASYLETLSRTSFLSQYLIWTRPDASYSAEIPPAVEWDIQVYSPAERNALLGSPNFIAAVGGSTIIRVLVNGLANATPQWSIWTFDNLAAQQIVTNAGPGANTASALLAQPDLCFRLSTAYDFADTSIAARDLRTNASTSPTGAAIVIGQRVLVNPPGAFWAIYEYNPSSPAADEGGFVIWRTQTYDTSDFFSTIDWYSTGYSAASPPTVIYPTEAARNATEGSDPTNLFVKITNGWGSNEWTWTVYDANTLSWNIVAYQNGTIALSDKFYDSTRFVYGLVTPTAPELANVSNRDGSWEIRALTEALRYGGMLLDIEANEVFFSMLHFIHSQQDEVIWAFKTSFIFMNGYNVPLTAAPVLVADQTENILSYVDEVKPYHNKVRDFAKQYSPPMDTARTYGTDFDKPPYLDPTTSTNRILDPLIPADETILTSQLPWSDWSSNYNILNPAADPVRKLNTTILFDRVSGAEGFGIGGFDDVSGFSSSVNEVTTQNYTGNGVQTVFTINASGYLDVYMNSFLQTINTDYTASVDTTTNITTVTYAIAPIVGASIELSVTSGNTAADRIAAANPNADLPNLLGLLFKGSVIEGGGLPNPAITTDVFEADGISNLYLVEDGVVSTVLLNSAPLSVGIDYTTNLVTGPATIVTSTQISYDGSGLTDGTRTFTVVGGQGTPAVFTAQVVGGVVIPGTLAITNPGNYITPPPLVANLCNVDLGTSATTFDLSTDIVTGQMAVALLEIPPSGAVITINLLPSVNISGDAIGSDVMINPAVAGKEAGYQLADPYVSPYHPEELVLIGSDDGLFLKVTTNSWTPGGPSQTVRTFDVSRLTGTTATLTYAGPVAQSIDGIFVFRNGIRATAGTDFTIDYFNRAITVNLLLPSTVQATNITVHTFGYGSSTSIVEQHLYSYAGIPTVNLTTVGVVSSWIGLVVNGTRSTNFSLVGSLLTFSPTPAPGDDVAITVYSGGASNACNVYTQVLAYTVSQTWTLTYPDTVTSPEVSGTIVDVNGLRLTPTTDYTVTGSTLVIIKVLLFTDVIHATTFANAGSLGIVTSTFTPTASGYYTLPVPQTNEYSLVSLNGVYLVPGVDYDFLPNPSGTVVLSLPLQPVPSGNIVATVFTGEAAREPLNWIVSTTKPAPQRMTALFDDGGWDTGEWSVSTWDQGGGPLLQLVNDVAVPMVTIDAGFENGRAAKDHSGVLAAQLQPTDKTISVDVSGAGGSPKLTPANPLPLPDTARAIPGVVWVNGERIEYYSLSRSSNIVTLGSLRRGTRGTAISQENRVVTSFVGDGLTTSFTVPLIGVTDVMVNEAAQSTPLNYSLSVGSATVITFPAPPAAGAFITIGVTKGYAHLAGTFVLSGTEVFFNDVPATSEVADRDASPMDYIIAG